MARSWMAVPASDRPEAVGVPDVTMSAARPSGFTPVVWVMVLLVTAQVPAKPELVPSMTAIVPGGEEPLPSETVIPGAAVSGPENRISAPPVLLAVGLRRVLT